MNTVIFDFQISSILIKKNSLSILTNIIIFKNYNNEIEYEPLYNQKNNLYYNKKKMFIKAFREQYSISNLNRNKNSFNSNS